MVRNEDILKDILLKMNYDPSKTLNENKSLLSEQVYPKPLPLDYYYYDNNGNLKTLPNLVSNYPAGSTPAKKVYPSITDGSKYPKQRMPGAPQLNAPKLDTDLVNKISQQRPTDNTIKIGDYNIPDINPRDNTSVNNIINPLDYKVAPRYTKNVYDGEEKPTPPVVSGQYIGKPGSGLNPNEVYWTLDYPSPNLTGTYYGNKGRFELDKIYKEDLKDWEDYEFYRSAHAALPWIATILYFVPYGAPFAVAIEAYDVYLYAKEGDALGATLGIIFAAFGLPAAARDLRALLPKTAAMSANPSRLKETFRKIVHKLPLNQAERAIKNEIAQHSVQTILVQVARAGARSTILNSFSRNTVSQLVVLYLKFIRAGIISAKWTIRGVSILAFAGALGISLTEYAKDAGIPESDLPSDEEIAKAKNNPLTQGELSNDLAQKFDDDIERANTEEGIAETVRAAQQFNSQLDSLNTYYGMAVTSPTSAPTN